jgi:acetyltransferase (GNAT) family protein
MKEMNFGTPEQVSLVQRANALWRLLADDPRYAFQARAVSLAQPGKDTGEKVIALARLQGYASCHFVPRKQSTGLLAAYKAAGLNAVQWEQYWGNEAALALSAGFLADYRPKDGLRLKTVMPDTPDGVVRAIADMSMGAGVLPPPGSAMRGHGPKGVFRYAETPDGRIVACGGGFMAYHRGGLRADEAFWGMLATDPNWRGQRLACWVGAQVIVDMADRFGAKGFSSGVKADNPSSQAMCARLGVTASDYVYAGATDPQVMGQASPTR